MSDIPARGAANRKYPWWDMEVGESVLIEGEPTYRMQCRIGQSLYKLTKTKKTNAGMKFRQRTERAPVPGVRVFRIE